MSVVDPLVLGAGPGPLRVDGGTCPLPGAAAAVGGISITVRHYTDIRVHDLHTAIASVAPTVVISNASESTAGKIDQRAKPA
jgi:hypothetical protein